MFHHIFQSSPIAITITNLSDGCYVDVNPAAEQLLGYSRAELIGRQRAVWEQTLMPEAPDALLRLLAEQGRVVEYPCTLTGRVGTPRDCLLSIERLELDGQVYALTHIVDISAQRQAIQARDAAEEALRQTRALFTRLFHTSPIATILTSLPEQRFLDMNAAAEALIGYPRDILLGQATSAFLSFDDPEQSREINALLTDQGRLSGVEVRLRTVTGAERVCLLSIETEQLEGTRYALIQIVDITARKAVELALQQASARLQILADASAAFAADGMDEGALLDTLTHRTAEALGSSCFIRLRQGNDPWLNVVAGHDSDPAILAHVEPFVRRTQVHIDAPHPAAMVVRSGQPRLMPVIDPEVLHAMLPPDFRTVFAHMRIHSEIIAPLRVQGQTVGCLILLRHTTNLQAFTQDDLTLAQDLADRAGLAIANARLYRDVQAAQRTAQQIHARIEALITSLPTGVGYLDCELRYQLVNPALAMINGSSPLSHLARMPHEIIPSIAREVEAAMRQVVETGQALHNIEMKGRLRPHDQHPSTWLVNYFPVPDAEGEIAGVGVTVTDITASRHTEVALQASMSMLHASLDSMTDAIAISDIDGRLIEFNAAFASFHRFQDKQACPPTLDAYPAFLEVSQITGESLVLEQWAVSRALRGETATNAEYILRRTDTGETWVGSYNFAPVRDQSGAIVGAVVISRDITASKGAELRLRQSEARFATIFERSPVALGLSRLSDSIITQVNEAFLSLFGYAREAVIGHTARELGIWADQQERQRYVEQLRVQQRIAGFETAMRTASGATRQMLLSGELIQIHDEPHILLQSIDITVLKEAQQKLQELNRTLEERVQQRTAEIQDLYDHAPTGYYSTNADNQIVRVNQTLLDWLGYTRAEVLGRWEAEFLIPEIRDAFVDQIPALKQRGHVQGLDAQLLRKDGSSFPVLLSVTSVYDADGGFVGNRATVFDNTQRKWAEDALRESEAQNRLLFEESPAAMALFDQNDRIVRANRAFAQLVGYPIERLRDQSVDTLGLLSSAQLAHLMAGVAPTLKHGAGFAEAVVTFTRATSEVRVVEIRAFALTIHGQWHSLASIYDITYERQTEETLRRANAELARAARAKDEFLANMSHELRTPINAILAYSESLQDAIYDTLTERQRGAVDAVATAGQHLLSLINDILDLAKVEASRMELQIQRVGLHTIGEASLGFVREQAHKKHLHLEFHMNNQDAMLEADPTRLKQMLVNLLSNAVKFTPAGGTVRLEITIDRADGVAQFVVADTGIGIASEDLERLFQPFSQVDAALDRMYEGTGLGLALVRRLAELHGGRVTVESSVGRGSRFTVALPYRDVPEAPPLKARGLPPELVGSEPVLVDMVCGQILLVEDNQANSGALSDYLQARGYDVIVACDGQEALARADEVYPQVIVMDIQMPGMDGMEVIRRLRAQPTYATIPIIALTALAMPGDKERCLAAGATLYLTKPVSMKGLVETIQQLLAS